MEHKKKIDVPINTFLYLLSTTSFIHSASDLEHTLSAWSCPKALRCKSEQVRQFTPLMFTGLPLVPASLPCRIRRPSSRWRLREPFLSVSAERREEKTQRIPLGSEKLHGDCKQQVIPRPMGISNENKQSHSNSPGSISSKSFPWEMLTGQNALFCAMLHPLLLGKGTVENSPLAL